MMNGNASEQDIDLLAEKLNITREELLEEFQTLQNDGLSQLEIKYNEAITREIEIVRLLFIFKIIFYSIHSILFTLYYYYYY